MAGDAEKVYVAIGTDLQDGLATLDWALKKWSCDQISIVILHADINKDYVYTYYGKVPASYVNDEKVDSLRKLEQGKMNKILNRYTAFCAKVKAETLNIEKYDEPIHKRIEELISGLHITKLVMGITFLKSSPWKYRNPLSGLKHIQRQKAEFCELYLICGGKLFVFKEENNEGFIEDDQGVMVAKLQRKRSSVRDWLGKIFVETGKSPQSSSSSSTSNDSPTQWEKCDEAIENYFRQLLDSNADEEIEEVSFAGFENNGSTEPDIPKDLNPAEKIEILKTKVGEAREAIQLKRREAKDSAERYDKARWAITKCTCRAEQLDASIKEEIVIRGDIEKNLDTVREELGEIQSEVEQRKGKLDSMMEIQRELSNKLKSCSLAKSQAEGQLEKMVKKRAGMVQEIEKLREQRDVLQRRIEFCRDKDAIEEATRLNDLSFHYKEFTAEEIRAGTEHFSERWRLKSSGDFANVYRGQISHALVAVKLYDSQLKPVSEEAFLAKVKILTRLQHPHLVAMLGFCRELKCIVFEYMHEGCLRDALHSSSRRKQALNWHARVRIAAEVCSGLSFLHMAKPRAVVHGNLNPSKILLDRNLVAKVHGFRLDFSYHESDIKSDIQDFGDLLFQLLTGRNRGGFLDEATTMDQAALVEVLDQRVGEWPLEVAMELAQIAISCSSFQDGQGEHTTMAAVMKEMEDVRKKADNLAAQVECSISTEGDADSRDNIIVPSFFFCPILQDIMKNPHVAADGFSYELDAIEQWFDMGHDTSPMTNLQLEHKNLTPNHTLRSLIHDWHNKRSIPLK